MFCTVQALVSGEGLNDDQWHIVRFTRRGESFRLQVDDETPSIGEFDRAAARQGKRLSVQVLEKWQA